MGAFCRRIIQKDGPISSGSATTSLVNTPSTSLHSLCLGQRIVGRSFIFRGRRDRALLIVLWCKGSLAKLTSSRACLPSLMRCEAIKGHLEDILPELSTSHHPMNTITAPCLISKSGERHVQVKVSQNSFTAYCIFIKITLPTAVLPSVRPLPAPLFLPITLPSVVPCLLGGKVNLSIPYSLSITCPTQTAPNIFDKQRCPTPVCLNIQPHQHREGAISQLFHLATKYCILYGPTHTRSVSAMLRDVDQFSLLIAR